MAYDYITRGVPTIPVPGTPALAVDIANDLLYIGNPTTGGWVPAAPVAGPATAVNLPASSAPTVGTVAQSGAAILSTFGTDNLFVGTGSGNFSLTGSDNTGLGFDALHSLTTATKNTAVGSGALQSITTEFGIFTTPTENTAVGFDALNLCTTFQNVAVGSQALKVATTGVKNTACGYSALKALTTGGNNAAIGLGAGQQITTGANNTTMGANAGIAITTGSNNVSIGQTNDVDTGSRNITIGVGSFVPDSTASNQMSIGNTVYGSGLNGPDTGSIGINVQIPTNTLDILGGITFSGSLNPLTAIVANGAVPVTGSANYVVTVATALTIAAPSVDDTRIEITTFDTATPVLTFTGNTLNSGSAAVATAHFAAFAGSSIILVSHTGKWNVISQNAVTFA
jgi:hypothetical protein